MPPQCVVDIGYTKTVSTFKLAPNFLLSLLEYLANDTVFSYIVKDAVYLSEIADSNV